jgi:eukaryotic-like serine/threonine-protein kinase
MANSPSEEALSEDQSNSENETAPTGHDASSTESASPQPTMLESTVVDFGATIDSTLAETDASSQVTNNRLLPRQFGDYILIEEIARGGMGVVYKAQQSKLNRTVALKMILSGQLASKADVARFYVEAEAAAHLEHSGIVPVFEVGECEGQQFFSMGFVEGDSLASVVRGGPLPPNEAAGLVEKVAQAIAFAHSKGVIHRDLKPANVLLDGDGFPKVTDFGLAKKTQTDSQLTGTGQILGTPSYMPPEQASGNTKKVGPEADVYSLGAILYCLLTGRPPFQAATVMDTLMQVIEQEPPPVRQLNSSVPADLEAICSKCLMKDASQRYATADDLVDDLQRFLSGETVSARNHSVAGRVATALQRSQYDVQFGGYSNLLYGIAIIVLLDQFAAAWVIWNQKPIYLLPLAHVAQTILIGLLFWRTRTDGLLPRNPAERQLWAVWGGFFITCTVLGISHQLMLGGDVGAELELYPSLAAASGFAFCFLGSTYWGKCYIFAAIFFALAFAMILNLAWAPVEFGAVWAAILTIVGQRLEKLTKE